MNGTTEKQETTAEAVISRADRLTHISVEDEGHALCGWPGDGTAPPSSTVTCVVCADLYYNLTGERWGA